MHLQDRPVLTATRPSTQPLITRILGFFDSTTKVLLAVGGLIAASIALWAALTSLVSPGSAAGTHAPSSPPAIHATAGNSASTNGNENTTNINGSGNSASTNGNGNTTNARGSGNSASTHGNGNITNINGSDNTSTIGGS
jgi:hypothetical protein